MPDEKIDIQSLVVPYKTDNPPLLYPSKQSVDSTVYYIKSPKTIVMDKGKRLLFNTGLYFDMPRIVETYVTENKRQKYSKLLLHARLSSCYELASKTGIILVGPTILEPYFTDELSVLLLNMGDKSYEITEGENIAELTFQFAPRITLNTIFEQKHKKKE